MNKLFLLPIFALSLCGCINVYTRFPFTNGEIETTYQSTECSMWLGSRCFHYGYGLGSVPVYVDTGFEFVADTLLYPFDYILEKSRTDKK